ncbi:MAG: RuBisCO accumulation factor 1, partial [Leptolyngbyaceae bacterium]|nr:RuBisCO accumulation factor 1 [Leptolyngbyaceae bacterium]
VILSNSQDLPNSLPGRTEEVLVVVDRAERDWDAENYYIVEQANQLQIQWFEETPDLPLLGRVILMMRPKQILDENVTKDPWQIDE